ncbi:MAG: endo-1,4-beta-xylanase [Bacteroidota bacterium]
MKPFLLKAPLLLLFTLLCGWLFAQVPDGGSMLNAETGTTYQKIGSCTVTQVDVEGQDFSKAIRVQVRENVSNAWDAQVKFPAVGGVEKTDVVLVAFYARTIESEEETGEGFLTVVIEHNVSYEKEISHKVSIGSEWREYYAPAEVVHTLATSEVSYLFHMGYPNQLVELAGVRFLNYHNTLGLADLPVTGITYVGRDPDAPWRAPAEERIAQHRKGLAEITIYDAQGTPVNAADVKIEMTSHQFGFGTAVTAGRINNSKVYRDTLFDMFNEVVFENDLKWPPFINTATHAAILSALDTLDAHHVPVRGHNIIWPSYRFMPDFMEDFSNDPDQMRLEIEKRFDEVTAFTKGRLNDWDVMNEPYTEHDVQDLLGDEVMAEWFRRTRRNDPGVKLYINDYYILSGGGINIAKQDYYYDLIRYIDERGGRIDGIGMQGHFSTDLTSISKVYTILDRFASLGKEIKITEHDIAIAQREVQADYTRDFMTIVFSHPSVKSILSWGFWAGAHWKPDAAYFDEDWNIRPHGEVLRDLIRNQWWTPAMDTVTDENGKYSFEGFLGSYSYTVHTGDTLRSGTFTLDHSRQSGISNSIVISMDGSIPESVGITPEHEGFICAGEAMTLKATGGEGLKYAWTLEGLALPDSGASIVAVDSGLYQVTVSKNGISLTSEPYLLEVIALPATPHIVAGGGPEVCAGESLTLSLDGIPDIQSDYEWFLDGNRAQWGGSSYEAVTAGEYTLKTTFVGCSAESEPISVTVLQESDPRCFTGTEMNKSRARIFPNPCHGSVQVELAGEMGEGYVVELYDVMGKLRHSTLTEQGTTRLTVPVPGPGLYMVKITRGKHLQTHKLLAR